jgi:hypothetical protein
MQRAAVRWPVGRHLLLDGLSREHRRLGAHWKHSLRQAVERDNFGDWPEVYVETKKQLVSLAHANSNTQLAEHFTRSSLCNQDGSINGTSNTRAFWIQGLKTLRGWLGTTQGVRGATDI